MYDYGVSFKSERYLQDHGCFQISSRCVTGFLYFVVKTWVCMDYAAISKSVQILFIARSLRYLKISPLNPEVSFIFS